MATPFDDGPGSIDSGLPLSRRHRGVGQLGFMKIRWECKRCADQHRVRQHLGTVLRVAASDRGPEQEAVEANSPRLGVEVAPDGHRVIVATCPTCTDIDGPAPARVIRRWDGLTAIFNEMNAGGEINRRVAF